MRGIMRCKLFGPLVAMFGPMLWIGAAAATLAGMVIGVSGSCTSHGRVLKRGNTVQVSETVTVPDGCHLQLRMADGSVISVAPDSSLAVASYNIGNASRYAKISLIEGLLRAFVYPVGGRSTFEVSTAVGTASVRSSSADWFIKAQA